MGADTPATVPEAGVSLAPARPAPQIEVKLAGAVLRIPPGTRAGRTFRVKGRGVPAAKGAAK